MINKRGQAAMEFLMTYGWALLVVLVAIGALAFFGVLNPGQFLPSTCTITPGIGCTDFKVDLANTEIILVLQNGIGDSLTDVTVSADYDGAAGADCDSGSAVAFSDGAEVTFTLTSCASMGAVGDKIRADLNFEYVSSGGLGHNKTGLLVTQVE
jgi:hypothetical protein